MAKRLTSHDVRHLHICTICKTIGAYGSALATKIDAPLVVRANLKTYKHPACMQIQEILSLPFPERGEIRMCDVDADTLNAILSLGAR